MSGFSEVTGRCGLLLKPPLVQLIGCNSKKTIFFWNSRRMTTTYDHGNETFALVRSQTRFRSQIVNIFFIFSSAEMRRLQKNWKFAGQWAGNSSYHARKVFVGAQPAGKDSEEAGLGGSYFMYIMIIWPVVKQKQWHPKHIPITPSMVSFTKLTEDSWQHALDVKIKMFNIFQNFVVGLWPWFKLKYARKILNF